MKKTLFLFLFLCSVMIGSAQVNWVSIDQAEKLAATKGKKIMVKVYAKWCGWCKEMDKATFPNTHVAKILNESFVCVQFNAEQKNNIVWGGKSYKIVRTKNGSYHELAAQWLRGQMSYPTIVFLDENGNVIQSIAGYQRAGDFEKMAAFFAQNAHKTTDWATFVKNYKRR